MAEFTTLLKKELLEIRNFIIPKVEKGEPKIIHLCLYRNYTIIWKTFKLTINDDGLRDLSQEVKLFLASNEI